VSACIRTGDIFADEPGKTLDDFLRAVRIR